MQRSSPSQHCRRPWTRRTLILRIKVNPVIGTKAKCGFSERCRLRFNSNVLFGEILAGAALAALIVGIAGFYNADVSDKSGWLQAIGTVFLVIAAVWAGIQATKALTIERRRDSERQNDWNRRFASRFGAWLEGYKAVKVVNSNEQPLFSFRLWLVFEPKTKGDPQSSLYLGYDQVVPPATANSPIIKGEAVIETTCEKWLKDREASNRPPITCVATFRDVQGRWWLYRTDLGLEEITDEDKNVYKRKKDLLLKIKEK